LSITTKSLAKTLKLRKHIVQLFFHERGRGGWEVDVSGHGHGPHHHGDVPVRPDDCVPDLGDNDFVVRADEVVVPLCDAGANHVDVYKGLLD